MLHRSILAQQYHELQDLLGLASGHRNEPPGSLSGDTWRWRCLDDELSRSWRNGWRT